MSNINVNQVNFEYPLSGSYHDILVNSGTNTPTLTEQISSGVLHIYVNQVNLEVPVTDFAVQPVHMYVNMVNLEVPVSELSLETLTNVGVATHTLLEEVIGTPIEEPIAPGHGAYSSDTWMPVVRTTRLKEYVVNEGTTQQSIEEYVTVQEELEVVAKNRHDAETVVRRPIYRKAKAVEVMHFRLARDKSIIIPPEEEVISKPYKKDEEELLLLGII